MKTTTEKQAKTAVNKLVTIVGAQWGDEGKGKIIDNLAQAADMVIRYQGGNNAGHSIVIKGRRFALRHLPSGVFNPKTVNILAQGMVINPIELVKEIEDALKFSDQKMQILISDRAHVILPYHLALDAYWEDTKANNKQGQMIGTTRRGIGPTYEDKYARIGLRMGELVDEKLFKLRMQANLAVKNKMLAALNIETQDVDALWTLLAPAAQKLQPLVTDTADVIAVAINDGKHIIFEGAQGAMLCVENGTYPFVTSSSPSAAGIGLATGVAKANAGEVIGIVKAYSTRVGAGAMPSEMLGEELTVGHEIRERGHEYGTVTRRPRRIGWLDLVALKHAHRENNFSALAITLLDVLGHLETIKVCTGYNLNHKAISSVPFANEIYTQVIPVYTELKGWKEDISKAKTWDDLPKEAQAYIRFIEQFMDLPVSLISVGPDREQTIRVRAKFN